MLTLICVDWTKTENEERNDYVIWSLQILYGAVVVIRYNVAGFTTTYMLSVPITTNAMRSMVFYGTQVSSTNKTDRHDITENTSNYIFLYRNPLICLFVLPSDFCFKKTYYFFTGSLLFMYLMVPAIKFWVKKRRYNDPKNYSSLILSQFIEMVYPW